MGKPKARILAKEIYFQFKAQKEIARLVGVTEKTIGDWIKKYGWKAERDARFNSAKNQTEQIKKLISKITEQRIALSQRMEEALDKDDFEKADELQQAGNRLADEVAKYNKALITIDKENRITLSVYLDVMDSIFKGIQGYDLDLFMKLLDFQELHLTEISKKLG